MGWNNANPWNVQDIEYLKKCHGRVTIDEAVEFLKRDKVQVYTKMKILNLEFKTEDPPGGMIWRKSLFPGILASETGLLWSEKKRELIVPKIDRHGERLIGINSAPVTVSRVVYGAFFGSIPEKHIVLRKDKDPANCDIGNLICMTRGEGLKRNLLGCRYPVAVFKDGLRIKVYPSTRAAAIAFKVSYRTIQYHIDHPESKAISKNKKLNQYEFKYLNPKKQAAGRKDVLARKKRIINDHQ